MTLNAADESTGPRCTIFKPIESWDVRPEGEIGLGIRANPACLPSTLRDGARVDEADVESFIGGNDAEPVRYTELRGVEAADDGALECCMLLRGFEKTDEKRRPLARTELDGLRGR